MEDFDGARGSERVLLFVRKREMMKEGGCGGGEDEEEGGELPLPQGIYGGLGLALASRAKVGKALNEKGRVTNSLNTDLPDAPFSV